MPRVGWRHHVAQLGWVESGGVGKMGVDADADVRLVL
jgi:hypothetical protein